MLFPRAKSKIFLFFLLSFIIGVFAGSFFDIGKLWIQIILGVAVFLIVFFWGSFWEWVFVGFFIGFFALGLFRINAAQSVKNILGEFVDRPDIPVTVRLRGFIDSEPERFTGMQRFVLRAKEVSISNYATLVNERVLISTDLYPEYFFGQFIAVTGDLRLPKNFDDFDYKAFLAKDNIYSTMRPETVEMQEGPCERPEQFHAVGKIKRIFECAKISSLKNIFFVKNKFQNSINQVITEPNAAFLNGILLGTRQNIPRNLKEDFRITGTTHILAISGYNITIIALALSFFLLIFMRRQQAFYFAVAGIILFTVLTGASASVVRAAIMGILVLLAYREGRVHHMTNAIVFAAAIMILFNPMVLRLDIGFQLSFMATLGLIYFAPLFEEKLKSVPSFFHFRENIVMTISAQFFVLPLILFHFKSLSLVSILANALILPVIPFAMLFGFLAGMAGIFSTFLGQAVGMIAWLLTSYEIGMIVFLARIPYAALAWAFPWWGVPLAYLGLAVLVRKMRKNMRA